MTDATSRVSARRSHDRRRVCTELTAILTAVTVAGVFAHRTGHTPGGPSLLMTALMTAVSAVGAVVVFPLWRARRHGSRPPSGTSGTSGTGEPGTPRGDEPVTAAGFGTAGAAAATDHGPDGTVLRRVRTTVRDEPGSLAALCAALADLRIDVVALQTHPLTRGTVDEFLLRTPGTLQADTLREAIARAGGSEVWIERADAHDLVDTPTRVLGLAMRTALDPAELPLALRQLLGRCTIRSRPADGPEDAPVGERAPVEGALEGTVIRLRDPRGGTVTVERPHLPFTPTEFARARALMELDARLDPRTPRGKDLHTLPEGEEIVVRRADQGDLEAAKEMQLRCSERTLRARYHGPVADAHRYLDHLLSPRHGRTLAVETTSGRLVALGHLLWDGEETEVALLVEDAWQRRGIGSELLGRLVLLARETGSRGVYAVTRSSNTGMVAAMRSLRLPLDYQVEEGTLVITAPLDAAGTDPRRPHEHAEH
ncbi:GNAT family N-acetyltransferase [Streptomyces sp. NPDC058953]|uniref:GNAT family N-acetyltransferase n=1 Tax=unclassified Streptomyces TaxID=2593676 RepID=UPI003697E30E